MVPQVYIDHSVTLVDCGKQGYTVTSFCRYGLTPEVNMSQWKSTSEKRQHSDSIHINMINKGKGAGSNYSCQAMLPITPSFLPFVSVPCDKPFEDASYIIMPDETANRK